MTYLWVAGNEGMEKNMETTTMGVGFRRNGKESGNNHNGLGFRRSGKEHGNDNNGLYWDCYKDPFLES